MEKADIIKQLAMNFRRLINQKNLSNAEVAEKCGISPATVSKILNSQVSITVTMLISICKGLDISPQDMLAGIIKKPSTSQKTLKNDAEELFAGVLSINHKRMACIKNKQGKIIGTSELIGDLDLAETIPSVFTRIVESINTALDLDKNQDDAVLKAMHLAVVVQSYEFEDTKKRFEHYLQRHFKSVHVLADWQITYFAAFPTNTSGISLVVDKGVSLSYEQNGKLKKLGGWKFPIYDLGGENWLGLTAVRHAIDAYEGHVPMSQLAKDVLSKFGGKIEKILETFFKTEKNPDVYCLFAETLLMDYFLEEEISQQIVQEGFSWVNKLVKKADQLIGKERKLLISGSLATIYQKFLPIHRLMQSIETEDKTQVLSDIARAGEKNVEQGSNS